jgi:hypothetical protein
VVCVDLVIWELWESSHELTGRDEQGIYKGVLSTGHHSAEAAGIASHSKGRMKPLTGKGSHSLGPEEAGATWFILVLSQCSSEAHTR